MNRAKMEWGSCTCNSIAGPKEESLSTLYNTCKNIFDWDVHVSAYTE